MLRKADDPSQQSEPTLSIHRQTPGPQRTAHPLREMGDYEQAISDLEAIRLSLDYADVLTKARGDLIAARADWERAIELHEAQEQPDEAQAVRDWLAELDD